jgi:hypothetical protein
MQHVDKKNTAVVADSERALLKYWERESCESGRLYGLTG